MRNIISKWQLYDKIVTIVSDNGANVKNAIIEHLRKYYHPCVAHTLNLITKDTLSCDELKPIISKCKKLVEYFMSGYRNIKNMSTKHGLLNIKIKQTVDTRWNSILLMLERVLETKNL